MINVFSEVPLHALPSFMGDSKLEDTSIPSELLLGENFESLPDELIVAILFYVDVEDLVCNVAQVCKRWRKLAKDVKVWEFSCVKYTDVKQFRKILSFAPCLAVVEFNWYIPLRADIKAIISGCPNVKKLKWCPSSEEDSEGPLQHLIKILHHYKHSLQDVDLYTNCLDLPPEHPKCILQMTVFSILSSMNSLRSLKLRGCFTHSVLCQDIFKEGWRSLESVDISKLDKSSNSRTFVLRLLEHKANSLKSLALSQGIFCVYTVPMFYSLCKSLTLETLRICESALEVVKSLNNLKTLHIMGLSDSSLSVWQSSFSNLQHYQRCFEWMRETSQFSKLSHLILENVNDDNRNIIRNLFSVCKDLKYLSLYGGTYTSSQLLNMLRDLRALKKLCIHRVCSFNSCHLNLLPVCLPNLCILDLRNCVFKCDGIFKNYQEVQSKLPNLTLFTDWGRFDKKSVKLFARSNRFLTFAACNNIQVHGSNADRDRVVKMLDEFSDYDDE